MGANLVGRAIAYAVDIPLQPNEFRLLIGVCHTALDGDSPPRYFDSREAMALILGRRIADESEAIDPERVAALKSVKVAMKGLVDLQALRRTKIGGHGRRAEFEVVLDVQQSQRTEEFNRRSKRGRMTADEARRRRGRGTAAVPVEVLRQSPLGDYGSTRSGTAAVPLRNQKEKQEPQQEEQVA